MIFMRPWQHGESVYKKCNFFKKNGNVLQWFIFLQKVEKILLFLFKLIIFVIKPCPRRN